MTEQTNTPALRFPGFSENWEIIKVRDLSQKTIGGGTPNTSKSNYWKGELNWIQSSDLSLDNLFKHRSKKYINDKALNNSSAKKIPANSIAIVSRVGVGKLVYINHEYATSQDFINLVHLNYPFKFIMYSLYLLLKGEANKLQGTSIKGLTKKDLLNYPLNIPKTIEEQEKIGVFFNKLDRQIELEEEKLELLEQQKRGYMQKIFAQELRFKDENGNDYPDWEETTIKNITNYISSKKSSNQYTENNNSEGYPVYDAIQEIGKDLQYDMKDTYISILKDGAGAGRLNLRAGKSSVIGTMGYIQANNVDIQFLYYRMKLLNFRKFIIGSTIPHLYYKDYSKEKILIPTSNDEQKKIGHFILNIDKLIDNKTLKLDYLKQRKKSVLQKMFV